MGREWLGAEFEVFLIRNFVIPELEDAGIDREKMATAIRLN